MPSQDIADAAMSAARAALTGTTLINLNVAAERTDWSPSAPTHSYSGLGRDDWPVLYSNDNRHPCATVPLHWFRRYLLVSTSVPPPGIRSCVMLVSGTIVGSLDLLNALTEYDRAATLYAAVLAHRHRTQARINGAFATSPPSVIQSHYRARSHIIRPLP